MKFNFKKIMLVAAIGLAAGLFVNSNLKVFADCPKLLVNATNRQSNDRLVIVTCVEKGENNSTYVFNVPLESSEVLKNFNDKKLIVKARNENKVVESIMEFNIDKGMSTFDMPANELVDGTYNFEIYDGKNLLGTFKNVEIKRESNGLDDATSLGLFDKAIVKTPEGRKTCDDFEGDYFDFGDGTYGEFRGALLANLNEIQRLSERVEGKARESILKNYDELKLVYFDEATGEKVLTKELKADPTTEIISIDKEFPLVLRKDEIEFGKTYDVKIRDKNDELIGTFKHEILKADKIPEDVLRRIRENTTQSQCEVAQA